MHDSTWNLICWKYTKIESKERIPLSISSSCLSIYLPGSPAADKAEDEREVPPSAPPVFFFVELDLVPRGCCCLQKSALLFKYSTPSDARPWISLPDSVLSSTTNGIQCVLS